MIPPCATSVRVPTVDEFRLLWMQDQLAGRESRLQGSPQRPCLRLASAVAYDVIRVPLEEDAGVIPLHPHAGTDSPRQGLQPRLGGFPPFARRRLRPPFAPTPSASVRRRAASTDNPYVSGPPRSTTPSRCCQNILRRRYRAPTRFSSTADEPS